VAATAVRFDAGMEMLLTRTKVSSESEFRAQNIATALARQTTAHIAVRCQNRRRILGRSDLSDCTIYSNVEPCPMCAFPIRETRIGRVVYAISSPMMGGLSKWDVLGDNEISNVMPEVFGDAPEVAAGLQYREAAAVWRKWNPVFWLAIRFRGCLADPAKDDAHLTLQARRRNRRPLRRLVAFLSQAMARKHTAAQSDLPS